MTKSKKYIRKKDKLSKRVKRHQRKTQTKRKIHNRKRTMKGGLQVFGRQVYGTNKIRDMNTLLDSYETEKCFDILNDPTLDKTWTKSKTRSCEHILNRLLSDKAEVNRSVDRERKILRLDTNNHFNDYKTYYCKNDKKNHLCDIVKDYFNQKKSMKKEITTLLRNTPELIDDTIENLTKQMQNKYSKMNDQQKVKDKLEILRNTYYTVLTI